ncbi:hypothetical protein E4T39_03322 [Aureobasidium subglaciale]|nr:hypothetical protein E4T39_03322 [Aureobasidium subglaciale]
MQLLFSIRSLQLTAQALALFSGLTMAYSRTLIRMMDDGREQLISQRPTSRRHPSWRLIVIINTISVSLVLVTHVAFLVWINSNMRIRDGAAELTSSSCSQVPRRAAYARFGASGFAVLEYSAGAHAIQSLLSPTRGEIDNGHGRDQWLHVGVGGLRNLKWIHKRRLTLATAMTAVCVLLPLLSTIYTTMATTDKTGALVTEAYLHGSRLDGATEQLTFLAKAELYQNVSESSRAALTTIDYDQVLQRMRNDLEDLARLSPIECRAAYSSAQLPSNYSNVFLVSSSNVGNTVDGFIDGDLHYSELAVSHNYQGMRAVDWFNTNGTASIVHNHCIDTDFDFGNGDDWNIPVWDYYCTAVSYPVQYCMAEKFEPNCGVSLDIRVFVGIVVCLFVEVCCLISLALARGFRPLATVGDAVVNFLKHPDPSTSKMINLAAPAVHSPLSRLDKFGFRRSEKDIAFWKRKWPVWRAAVDTETCALSINCLFLGFFAVWTAVLIIYNSDELSGYQPLDHFSPTSGRGLIANLFGLGAIHIPIFIVYLFYNHLWSRMLAAAELNACVKARAPLRVTLPTQGANKTYYFNIKPHFSAFLLLALVFIHFLTSQALHIIAIQTYDVMGNYSHQRITYGVSTSSAILALVIAFVMLCALAYGLEKKLDAGMPVLGTCSFAISAACHAYDGGERIGQVRYGRNARTGRMGFVS